MAQLRPEKRAGNANTSTFQSGMVEQGQGIHPCPASWTKMRDLCKLQASLLKLLKGCSARADSAPIVTSAGWSRCKANATPERQVPLPPLQGNMGNGQTATDRCKSCHHPASSSKSEVMRVRPNRDHLNEPQCDLECAQIHTGLV